MHNQSVAQEPERIGRYQIIRELGRGGMAVVYLGIDPHIKREVAIKALPRQLSFSPDFRRRFQQEVEVIARLEHPAIVTVYDFGEDEDMPYIVMRYMPGGTLRQRMQGQPFTVQQVSDLLSRIAPALDKAHREGIIHRDLKPDNILFDADNLPYLSDFGIARMAEATQTMTMIGTPAYMSPEQWESGKVDGRSDLYALGVILFELLTGRPPFSGDTPARLMRQHLLEAMPDPLVYNQHLTPPHQALLQCALDKKPDNRFPTAKHLLVALQQANRSGREPSAAIPSSDPNATLLEDDLHAHSYVSPVATEIIPTSSGGEAIAEMPKQRILSRVEASDGTPRTKSRLTAWSWVILLIPFIAFGLFWALRNSSSGETEPTLIATILAAAPVEMATVLPTFRPTGTPTNTHTPTPIPIFTPTTLPPSPTLEPPTTAPSPTLFPHLAENLIAYEVEVNNKWHIFLVSLNGSNRRLLPSVSLNHRVANFAPDGERIAFRAMTNDTWQIFTMRIDGENLRQITTSPGNNYEANWSPDGQHFAFISDRDGNKELYLMYVDGSNQIRLTNNAGRDDDPSWSPDGEWIVFESLRDGRADVYKIRPDGSDLTRLTINREWNATPSWSPDGQWIAFVSGDNGQEHVWIMQPDGSNQHQLTIEGTLNHRPAWSPNSQQIAIASNRDGQMEIWIINSDGSSPMKLTSEGGAINPAWSRW